MDQLASDKLLEWGLINEEISKALELLSKAEEQNKLIQEFEEQEKLIQDALDLCTQKRVNAQKLFSENQEEALKILNGLATRKVDKRAQPDSVPESPDFEWWVPRFVRTEISPHHEFANLNKNISDTRTTCSYIERSVSTEHI